MTYDEYKEKLEELESDFDGVKKRLAINYAIANNPHKIGDVVRDHMGSITVERIIWSISSPPCAVYDGVMLKADGTPNVNGTRRKVWQSNLKK